MSEQNKEVVRGCWNVAGSHDVSGFDRYYDKDVIYHGGDAEIRGLDNLKAYLQGYLTAFPDLQVTVEDIFGEGDKVFSRARIQGTNTGQLMGMPATGKSFDLRWIMNAARLANGKIVEEWEILDQMDLLRQLGVVDAATPAATV